jgi:hypothetical protein
VLAAPGEVVGAESTAGVRAVATEPVLVEAGVASRNAERRRLAVINPLAQLRLFPRWRRPTPPGPPPKSSGGLTAGGHIGPRCVRRGSALPGRSLRSVPSRRSEGAALDLHCSPRPNVWVPSAWLEAGPAAAADSLLRGNSPVPTLDARSRTSSAFSWTEPVVGILRAYTTAHG